MKRFLLLLLLLPLGHLLRAQSHFKDEITWEKGGSTSPHQVFVGAETPLFWTVGYRHRAHKNPKASFRDSPHPLDMMNPRKISEHELLTRVSFQAQVGYIAWPHNKLAAQMIGRTAVDTKAAAEALDGGLVAQMGLNYHFPIAKREFYVGWRLHVVHNRNARISVDEPFINAYTSFPNPGVFFDPAFQSAAGLEDADYDILATGTLLNTGIVVGTEFQLGGQWSLRTELGFTRFLWGEQKFEAADDRLTPFYEPYYQDIDNELNDRYEQYLNLPSINLLLGYNF